MLWYHDGNEVRAGDHVRYADTEAVVETIIEEEEVARWGLEKPGFMLLSNEWGHVLMEPGTYDWEEVALVGRGGEADAEL
jgi:hypothetical protein